MMNFKIRIYQSNSYPLSAFTDITLSGITILRKNSKFDFPHLVESNMKKFGYSVQIKGKFYKAGGSHSCPTISFKNDYIDIIVKNFPRFPVFTQEYYIAKNELKGKGGYIGYVNKGFPTYEKFRKIEILYI